MNLLFPSHAIFVCFDLQRFVWIRKYDSREKKGRQEVNLSKARGAFARKASQRHEWKHFYFNKQTTKEENPLQGKREIHSLPCSNPILVPSVEEREEHVFNFSASFKAIRGLCSSK